MRKLSRFAVSLLLGTACSLAEPERARTIELVPCQLGDPGSSMLAATCGKLAVPEDRSRPEGRRIDLRVAVVPALSRHPEPDPLVFLAGGPGQAASETYPVLAPAFSRVNRDRDILLVDQRGTGGSNALQCREEGAAELALLDEETIPGWVSRCLTRLDADPRFYTTSIAIDDLDEVREALGYERVNLYGVSYGTRAALTYLRRFPDRVRTAILDGVVPPEAILGLDAARDAQRALELTIERCSSDPACAVAFGDLHGDVDRLMGHLQEPVRLTLRHPRTGELQTLAFGRDMAAYAIRLLSYTQETAALLPLLLHTAAQSEIEPLAAQFLLATARVEETMAEGMGISVVCTEDFPFFQRSAIEARNRGTYLRDLQTESLSRVCPLWPEGDVPPDFRDPVSSPAAVLLLSGEADPVTPPANGELVASELGRALHVVAAGQGHVMIHRGCIPRLVVEFLDAGTLDGLDTGCVAEIEAQPFFLDFAGPAP